MKNMCNMKTLSAFVSSLFVSTLLFTSCQKGDQGVQGATGSTGAAGATGATGATGAAGNTILSGEGAPADTLGRVGDFYLEIDNSEFYGPKTASGWGTGVSLIGQPGETGAQGDPGAQGPAGPSGVGALVDTFSIASTEWSVGGYAYAQNSNFSAYPYSTQHVDRYNNIITQGILDSGMVLVSFTANEAFNSSQYLSLPYLIVGHDPVTDSVVNYNWSYVTAVNKVTLQFYVTPTANGYFPDISNYTVPNARYKVVVIPAAVAQEITAVTNKRFTSQGRVITL
jgi:hypothetical protein